MGLDPLNTRLQTELKLDQYFLNYSRKTKVTCRSIGNLSYYYFFICGMDGTRFPEYKTSNGIKIEPILFELFKKNQSENCILAPLLTWT